MIRMNLLNQQLNNIQKTSKGKFQHHLCYPWFKSTKSKSDLNPFSTPWFESTFHPHYHDSNHYLRKLKFTVLKTYKLHNPTIYLKHVSSMKLLNDCNSFCNSFSVIWSLLYIGFTRKHLLYFINNKKVNTCRNIMMIAMRGMGVYAASLLVNLALDFSK